MDIRNKHVLNIKNNPNIITIHLDYFISNDNNVEFGRPQEPPVKYRNRQKIKTKTMTKLVANFSLHFFHL